MNRLKLLLLIMLVGIFGFRQPPIKKPHVPANTPLLVHKCTDFEVTGAGDNQQWNAAEWNALSQLDPGVDGYDSRFKVLYSTKGIYVLFDGKDRKITTTYQADFEDLFNADVFEVFFHPDPAMPLYFEYEINHLNKELVLIIPNLERGLYGWTPWHYEGERKIRKAVHIEGGKQEPGASITSWRAELFIPFALLAPMSNVPPKSGTVWNANFYRLDYDTGKMIKWAWSPIAQSFHEYKKFGSIQFE